MSFLPKNPIESFKRRNPHIYGQASNISPVRPVDAGSQEFSQRPALVNPRTKRQKGKGNVEVIVTLITCRTREADDDNNIASLKPIRDAIAESLGLDDGDSRLKFEYGQTETRGMSGVIVKIERL